MLKLIKASNSKEYKDEILDMLNEWSDFNNVNNNANHSPMAIFSDYSDFDQYIKHFLLQETNPIEGFVPATTYFALDTERNKMVGAIQIRHYLNDALRNGGGHIGDGVRPSERKKGYATEIIRLGLIEAKKLGIDNVLICCSTTNIGSRKSILNNGGVYEKTVTKDGEEFETYWIQL